MHSAGCPPPSLTPSGAQPALWDASGLAKAWAMGISAASEMRVGMLQEGPNPEGTTATAALEACEAPHQIHWRHAVHCWPRHAVRPQGQCSAVTHLRLSSDGRRNSCSSPLQASVVIYNKSAESLPGRVRRSLTGATFWPARLV